MPRPVRSNSKTPEPSLPRQTAGVTPFLAQRALDGNCLSAGVERHGPKAQQSKICPRPHHLAKGRGEAARGLTSHDCTSLQPMTSGTKPKNGAIPRKLVYLDTPRNL